jgi:2-phosphoglycerate kinase
VLAVHDLGSHRSRFWTRDVATDGVRPVEKYLDGMPEIRLIQEALLDRARRHDVPVIATATLDEAVGEVLDLVLARADALVREPARR